MTGGNGRSNSFPKTADFVVLGAGVMGTSIAFHLANATRARS
jgi:glycine/D-amino acid oxidase-like deaminating enzyme